MIEFEKTQGVLQRVDDDLSAELLIHAEKRDALKRGSAERERHHALARKMSNALVHIRKALSIAGKGVCKNE